MKYVYCKKCTAKIYDWQDSAFAEGMTVCRSCYEDTFICDECGDAFFNDNAGDNDKPLCKECAAYYHRCMCCDKLVYTDDTVWYYGKPYCYDCYSGAMRS